MIDLSQERAAYYARHGITPYPREEPSPSCPHCSRIYKPIQSTQRYCSSRCQQRAKSRRQYLRRRGR